MHLLAISGRLTNGARPGSKLLHSDRETVTDEDMLDRLVGPTERVEMHSHMSVVVLTLNSFSFWYQTSSSSCGGASMLRSSRERERILRRETISPPVVGPHLKFRTRKKIIRCDFKPDFAIHPIRCPNGLHL